MGQTGKPLGGAWVGWWTMVAPRVIDTTCPGELCWRCLGTEAMPCPALKSTSLSMNFVPFMVKALILIVSDSLLLIKLTLPSGYSLFYGPFFMFWLLFFVYIAWLDKYSFIARSFKLFNVIFLAEKFEFRLYQFWTLSFSFGEKSDMLRLFIYFFIHWLLELSITLPNPLKPEDNMFQRLNPIHPTPTADANRAKSAESCVYWFIRGMSKVKRCDGLLKKCRCTKYFFFNFCCFCLEKWFFIR